ncbi:MAG: Asp-tRNA(Asn)/Glu-tRNA(Gln) amidotransferase subunit GatA [Coriobacteriaceae bacterium]|nr:Asp-tRNA(Asn)/Glu-tRNA(Gln) amidotransferase subunit GatA [Coriobacteriaceae bacterium]MDD7112202.1 Asp-tRNA(Asn)/Glu-tRNA(Gln) amidotransferase subunit GatA [Coriobacteriaceae bacterium]MDY5809342.1 Asp-tRNA(Asn)/Glu-tRNA(Gln) amidotransferase subunit GatA [Coriobacteriales bacterium]
MAFDIDALSAAQIAAGVAAGDFSAREVAQAALANVESREGDVHAFLEVSSELALQAADAIDAKRAAGEQLPPMAGVPCAFKDNMHLVGTRCTCASRMLENYQSTFTATAVQRMLDAGCIPVGKTNMDEFAFGSSTESSAFGPTCNPRDLGCVPGGSSGGSAAAVAAGMTTVTLGSDTGGSIRQPAAFCGVVGMKPTYGMVSRYGVVAFGSSLDQVGPFGRTVEDVALSMNALAGRDLRDCTSQPWNTDFLTHLHDGVAGKRIGVIPSLTHAEGVSAEVSEAIEAAAANLASAGAELVEVELPNAAAAISAYYVLAPCEAFSNLARFDGVRYGHQCADPRDLADMSSRSRAEGFGPEVKRRIMLGAYLLSSGVYDKYYYPAQQVRALITQDYKNAFQKVDAVLMPSAPFTAFKFGELSNPTQMYMADMFTVPLNIAGNCGVSVPVGLGRETGRPVGAQLIGPAFADDQLLRIAATLQGFYPELPVSKDFAKGEQR